MANGAGLKIANTRGALRWDILSLVVRGFESHSLHFFTDEGGKKVKGEESPKGSPERSGNLHFFRPTGEKRAGVGEFLIRRSAAGRGSNTRRHTCRY